jgi:hypothetical protein
VRGHTGRQQNRRVGLRIAAAIAVGASMLGKSVADEAPAKSQPSDLSTITVEARRARATLEKQVSTFVTGVMTHYSDESLARWDTAVCPLVAGLPRDAGEFVLARLSQIVRSVDAPLAAEDCRANLYVIVTREPDLLLKSWRRRDAHIFGNAPPGTIRRFLNTPRPVRVWYNADISASDGVLSSSTLAGSVGGVASNGALGGGNGGTNSYPTNTRPKPSRLIWNEVQALSSVIVIVDSTKLKAVSIGQLADYIGLIALAEVRLDTDSGTAPTILHLFADSKAATPQQLSAWDQALLKSLYDTPQKSVMQLSQIKTGVLQSLAP